MPVVRSTDAVEHHVHGSTFSSFVAPSRGSAQLCAWRLSVPADVSGVPHRPNREEVLLILDGTVRITVDGQAAELTAGDVAVVPAGSELCLDSGPAGASAWVTSTSGLEAVMPDGSSFAPPWAN
ncbi:MAG: cupin domain-containing protein [Pseudonocardiales bacterium]|nr:MAG: cupin domain-containing protein [Pseudonocardiales bacterium]